MSFKVKTTRKNKNSIRKLKKSIKKGVSRVEIGVVKSEKHTGSETTIAQVAAWNEFGTDNIPERSFLRSTIKEERSRIKKEMRTMLPKIAKGELTTDNALGRLGTFTAGKVQKKIVDLRTPPNAPSTRFLKKSTNPLIDTGQLLQSVTYRVRKGKKK